MITIVDYGSGNIRAIGNIYERLKIEYKIARKPEELIDSDKILLPGVGAFDETIEELNNSGLREVLDNEVLTKNAKLMGICVGMQILSEGSDEGSLPGLGYIKGRVKKFDKNLFLSKPKLPHMGWNDISIKKSNKILNEIDEKQGFYFLHSYYFDCLNPLDILCTTNYGLNFASAVNKNNIFGMQFHPEKSHQNGIVLLRNFALL